MANRSSLAVYQVENAVRVSGALAAYLKGNVESIIELCADDVLWVSIASPEHAPFGGAHRGRQGVRRFFEAMFSAYEISPPHVVDVIPAGDEVLHIVQLEASKRDGSSKGGAYVVGRWRFKDGRVISYYDYFDVAAALQTSAAPHTQPTAVVTCDASFDVYENCNAIRVSEILVAYKRGDLKPLFDALHPNVAWRSLSDPEHARFGGLFRGVDSVRVYFKRLGESLILDDYNVIDVIPAGPDVLHVAEVRARSTSDPMRTVFVRLVCIWTIENGQVTELREYFDVPSYLAQLGYPKR